MNQEARKVDADDFHVTHEILRNNQSLGSRSYWLDFLFHFTEVSNVKSILKHGSLLSRTQLESRDIKWSNAANLGVISGTDSSIKDFVRLYFRPRTPTAYQNEGIRPRLGFFPVEAHCPVPVYLVFDKMSLLTREDSLFSDGNLARESRKLYRTASEFSSLPFQDIYSDGPWQRESADEIKNRRHAEVVIPGSLSLRHLKAILSRSQAEYETLRNLLGSSWKRWKHLIRPSSHPDRLYYMNWLHVTSATLADDSAQLQFHPPNVKDCGPFNFKFRVEDLSRGYSKSRESSFADVRSEMNNMMLRLDLAKFRGHNYTLRLEIDGSLAYLGKYEPEIPF